MPDTTVPSSPAAVAPLRGGRAGCAPGRRGRRRERGQALVLVLPLLFVLSIAALWVFDAGHAVAEKRRLADAADAAAFSAAVWQARTLNFGSYANRAIVANEVAIAQSVSLRSWSSYMDRLLTGGAVVSRWVPVLNVVSATLQRMWTQFDAALQPGLTGLETAMSVADHELAAAQRLMHLAAFEAVPEAVRTTLAANDPRFVVSEGGEALLVRWASEWAAFTSSYGGAWRWRQADVIERSLDGFTTQRGHTIAPGVVGELLRVEKRGGTERIDFETWRAMDTLSLHGRSGLIVGRMRERVPLAWGAAWNGEFVRAGGEFGGSIRTNPRASTLAVAAQRRPRGYLGLPSLRDLSVTQRRQFDPPRVVVGAEIPAHARRTGSALLGSETTMLPVGSGRAIDLHVPGQGVRAIAAAWTPFHRPGRRADGAEELPSLYGPYWMARLARIEAADRLLAAAVDRAPILPDVGQP